MVQYLVQCVHTLFSFIFSCSCRNISNSPQSVSSGSHGHHHNVTSLTITPSDTVPPVHGKVSDPLLQLTLSYTMRDKATSCRLQHSLTGHTRIPAHTTHNDHISHSRFIELTYFSYSSAFSSLASGLSLPLNSL